MAKLNINIPWIEGLSFTSNVSFDKNILNRKLWEIPWTLYSWDGQSVDDNNIPVLNPVKKGFESPQLTQRMEDGKRITINGLLNYEKSIAENIE